MKKVLFLGFKPIQLELVRKFIEYRGCVDAIEVVPEQGSSGAVDAYLVNGDDPSVDSRLALHVRVNPRPVLGIGGRNVLGATLYIPGSFKPGTVDKLLELLGAPNSCCPTVETKSSGGSTNVVNFPSVMEAAKAEVLVVDDSDMVRRTMTQKITEYGHRVDVATSGDDAMAMLLSGSYKLVFLDVMMPGTDGFEVCKRIKRSREYKDCSVYMLTSKDGMFDKVRGSMAGCDGYLVKPLESRMLRKVLDKHFERPSNFADSDVSDINIASHPLNAAERAAIEGMPSARVAAALPHHMRPAVSGSPAPLERSFMLPDDPSTEFKTTFAPTMMMDRDSGDSK